MSWSVSRLIQGLVGSSFRTTQALGFCMLAEVVADADYVVPIRAAQESFEGLTPTSAHTLIEVAKLLMQSVGELAGDQLAPLFPWRARYSCRYSA